MYISSPIGVGIRTIEYSIQRKKLNHRLLWLTIFKGLQFLFLAIDTVKEKSRNNSKLNSFCISKEYKIVYVHSVKLLPHFYWPKSFIIIKWKNIIAKLKHFSLRSESESISTNANKKVAYSHSTKQ